MQHRSKLDQSLTIWTSRPKVFPCCRDITLIKHTDMLKLVLVVCLSLAIMAMYAEAVPPFFHGMYGERHSGTERATQMGNGGQITMDQPPFRPTTSRCGNSFWCILLCRLLYLPRCA
ncbi:hypothetical protein ElyMa_001737300 [Elysia marginata]|uniref:Uncharacterized protein n=1 Tax=Elysia marginata TaxID=1093978 RepID=A0AAV4JZ93_9GAST|nr:hypothetical protein ElyMa_001737300 [Elysia marginata]